MRANVFTDARLLKLAGQFAWLDIDTEQPRNFAFVEQFPIEAWPTIFVIDPATEQVVMRWMGTASAPELEKLLRDAEGTLRHRERDAAGAAMARAAAFGSGRKYAEAAGAYREALAAGGPGWSDRPQAADSLLQALTMAQDAQGCADTARSLLPTLAPGQVAARLAGSGLGCAADLEADEQRAQAIAALEPAARAALRYDGVLDDDRSGLYEALLSARRASKDEAGARKVAGEWLGWVEARSAKATSPLARSAYDGARLTAAVAIGQPARALPALEASARALPDQFFALSYLARAQLEAGRPREAASTAAAAATLADGPRKVGILVTEAKALRAAGDLDGARRVLEEAVQHGESLPEAVRPKSAIGAARKLQAELSPPATLAPAGSVGTPAAQSR